MSLLNFNFNHRIAVVAKNIKTEKTVLKAFRGYERE